MTEAYKLYINNRYFGTYNAVLAALEVVFAQTCKWEICKDDPRAFAQGIMRIVSSGGPSGRAEKRTVTQKENK